MQFSVKVLGVCGQVLDIQDGPILCPAVGAGCWLGAVAHAGPLVTWASSVRELVPQGSILDAPVEAARIPGLVLGSPRASLPPHSVC